MGKSSFDIEKINNLCNCLTVEAIQLIDFDELKNMLMEMPGLYERNRICMAELELMKEDYRTRIIGMLKANMTCRADDGDTELVARISGDLSEIEAGQLIKLYMKTATRFRANFPASFKYLKYTNSNNSGTNWMDYKI